MPLQRFVHPLRHVFSAAFLALSVQAQAATEIQFWHSMNGADGEAVLELVKRFNASQTQFQVVPTFKAASDVAMLAQGTMPSGASTPHIVQVLEPSAATLMTQRKLVRPMYQVMSENGQTLDGRTLIPGMAGYFGDKSGKLMALPFNNSTAILYYNKAAFKRAGLDPNNPPKTWRDVQEAALAVKDTKTSDCGYTTDWQSWIHLENLASWHNQEFATKNNGLDGPDARLNFNNILMIRHVALLSSWAKSGIFTYAGRANDGESKFKIGECAMLTSSSSAYGSIAGQADFDVGVAPLPYYDEFDGAPFTSNIGGTSLWVIAAKTPLEYKGVAQFLAYLAKPGVQAEWHQRTGYLPLSRAAYDLSKSQGFYLKHPGYEVAVRQVLAKPPTMMGRGMRLGNVEQIRAIIDEELEQVWAQKKAPKAALDEAVERGNLVLRQFEHPKR